MASAKSGKGSRGQQEKWWSQWPVAILLGLGSLSMALTGALPLVLFALLSAGDQQPSGTDIEFQTGPGLAIRILYVALALLFLVVPAFVVWSARRRLLGFLLLGLIASVLAMCWGLATLGIL